MSHEKGSVDEIRELRGMAGVHVGQVCPSGEHCENPISMGGLDEQIRLATLNITYFIVYDERPSFELYIGV